MMEYLPTRGFFDLTERPKGMSATTHKKIQGMQNVLISEAEKYKDPVVRQNNLVNYEKQKEYMAQVQSIVLSHWPNDMLFYGCSSIHPPADQSKVMGNAT